MGRRDALKLTAASAALPSLVGPTLPAAASTGMAAKRTGLSPEEMAAAVKADIVDRQFLVTGALSRELYDESCMFKDEIDTCTTTAGLKNRTQDRTIADSCPCAPLMLAHC